MTQIALSEHADTRCGTQWLRKIDPAQRNEILSALLSRFNHDLRTPLNTIMGWTHLLQKGGLEAERARHVAEVIGRNARDQTQLLEDFVDDGQTILGFMQLQAAPLRMDDTVGRAILRNDSALTLHGVFLKSKLEAADVSVNADPRRMERLIYRLLVVITRRAREASSIELETGIKQGAFALSMSGSAYEPDWSEAALLELRIASLVTALHAGELSIGEDPTRPCIEISLPRM